MARTLYKIVVLSLISAAGGMLYALALYLTESWGRRLPWNF
jgi:hypothetical protein